MVLQFRQQYYETNNNEFVLKNYNYNECECAEICPETSFKLIIALTAGCIFYSFVKSDDFPETMIRVTYKAFYKTVSMYTKMNSAYNKLTSYFLNKYNKNNNKNESTDDVLMDSTESYTNYEIRVIKNGVKYEQFETMKLFKKSNYLGNPNDYCDSQDDESQQSHSFNGCDSQDDDENQQPQEQQQPQQPQQEEVKLEKGVKDEKCEKDELFIMKHNKQNNTIQFKPYDFIMQTFFEKNNNQIDNNSNNSYNKQNKNYTKLYRKFTENDYSVTTKDHVVSKAGMIICSLELKDVSYDIDISFPYNFNVVGNIILDYTFLSWYMMKEYNVVIPECEYTLTCISNAITTYKLGNSSGLLVNLNDYEIINAQK
jgi:hypothetical protein